MQSIAAGQTRTPRRAARPSTFAAIAALGLLATPAFAASAHPKRGAHFGGRTSAAPVNGFFAPVTFTVSKNGGSLIGFRYSTFGCFGSGGFRLGIDYYAHPEFIISAGKVKLSSGRFSATGAVSAHSGFGNTTTTTSSVSGSFTKPTSAKGTITFSQKIKGKFSSTCGPAKLGFSATAR